MLFIVYLLALSLGAYVPSEEYTTLTPDAKPTGTTDYPQSFGIQIETFDAEKFKRDASPTETEAAPTTCVTKVYQIIKGDSGPVTKLVNQIDDGQIQNQPTASVVNQIDDGQIQNQDNPPAPTASVVNQIDDGQIQNQDNPPAPTASVINQIDDGQIQNQESPATASVINQIDDGQIQNQDGADQIEDGQVQNQDSSKLQSCATENSLSMTLKGGILKDSKGRIGSVVANRQFQFDGPPPQAGAIYAAGWSILDGYLALGDQTEFFQCKSGDFYNLYDKNDADQCHAVKLAIVDFVDC